ncbi:related to tetracycline resistance proteins [Fusarium mangiferae]|uniref:Related to tetracycline resistance proteins n=1 Tax=Fusarium mangiferae TaxID=192010 RepID=A0A1L7UBC3_FUSMA|nr:related to tetracycline resistance proteins [Fusarium mangiferae]CVL07729.1 related to tetracycline resistance proteins [Fusarium mangiferae]
MAEASLGAAPKQDLQSTSTAKATSPTFHKFRRLPPELRLKIWKEACLSRSASEKGLHYVTVDIVDTTSQWKESNVDPVTSDPNIEGPSYDYEGSAYATLRALECPWEKTGDSQPPANPLNKSAYLWDAGLWSACKESREVIEKHLNVKEWLAHRGQGRPRGQPAWYNKAFPSAIVPKTKNDNWCPLVKPYGDIFCIDTCNLDAVPDSFLEMMLLAPCLGTKTFTVVGAWNIGFKFEQSWMKDIPSKWSDLDQGAVGARPSLWIIDDTVRWVARSHQRFFSVWRDLEDEYVAIGWNDTRSNLVDGTQGAVADFMTALEQLADREDYLSDSLLLSIRLLVRKDNMLPGFI